jgi:hydrogenase expression/formation protein HypE
VGKLKTEDLKDLLKCFKKTSEVIVPPMPGFDSGAHKIADDLCMVVSTDPCIGVPNEWFGWFLIHYAASDVAIFGARPQYAAINLLGPLGTRPAEFQRIVKQACDAADDLNTTVITGHTGTYSALSSTVGTCTVYGIIKREQLITPAGAKPGDYLICTKSIGLETLVNFTLAHKKTAKELFGAQQASKLIKQVRMQTCVNEALLLAETGVNAMHDATEGGFVAALNEMGDASKVGFLVDYSKLPILPELRKLAKHYKLSTEQVLSASSTGTLLVATSKNKRKKALKALAKLHLDARIVGTFLESRKRKLKLDEREIDFPPQAEDPYAELVNA